MTRDDIIRMAREIFDVETDNRGRETFSGDNYGVERFAAIVAAVERERFADECIDIVARWGGSVEIEAAIRARSNT